MLDNSYFRRYNKAINKLLSNIDCIVAHLIGFVKGGEECD